MPLGITDALTDAISLILGNRSQDRKHQFADAVAADIAAQIDHVQPDAFALEMFEDVERIGGRSDQQCIDFRLPRTPIKETEHRAGAFEARFGEGATELDALEALHPGALRRILVENIERFHDSDLRREMVAVEDAIRLEMSSAESEVRARHADEIAAIEQEQRTLKEQIQEKLDELQELIDEREDALTERIEALLETIQEELEDAKPDIDDYEWPSPAEGDEFEDPLFDSRRGYLDQIDRYARFKGKEIAVCQGPRPKARAKAYGERHAVDRAAEAIKASPEKSTREIAEELGIPMHTVRRARHKCVDISVQPAIALND